MRKGVKKNPEIKKNPKKSIIFFTCKYRKYTAHTVSKIIKINVCLHKKKKQKKNEKVRKGPKKPEISGKYAKKIGPV